MADLGKITAHLDLDTSQYEAKLGRIRAWPYTLRVALGSGVTSGLVAGIIVHMWR